MGNQSELRNGASSKLTFGPEQFADCLSSDGVSPHWEAAAEIQPEEALPCPRVLKITQCVLNRYENSLLYKIL